MNRAFSRFWMKPQAVEELGVGEAVVDSLAHAQIQGLQDARQP